MKKICSECNIAYKKSLRANICDDCNQDEVLELQMVLLNKKNNKNDSVRGVDLWDKSRIMTDMLFPDGIYGSSLNDKESEDGFDFMEKYTGSKIKQYPNIKYLEMPPTVQQEKDIEFLKNMENK
jgi:hypothetical protein